MTWYLSFSKLIRARVYTTDSARDTEGHGSHTASTAARNNIVNASFSGLAEGTARGGFHQQGLLHIKYAMVYAVLQRTSWQLLMMPLLMS
ncbi:hypothetical protein Goklo_013012 [Gossypium klotzschianum]|uniref:Peptidase S8/S53 domain-containing protein n=1 Tax=Gossypium klotzschianum TaxID=34286 RepID=A0A7J8U357_9ROSI|nr:hypothetical protein [Gossypium klotzschianum]